MNEDYLWDKTGSDAEIERLETALAAFRYRETAPPALPVETIPFKKTAAPRRKALKFALAIAACLALAITAFGIWFWISNEKTELKANVTSASPIAETLTMPPTFEAPKTPSPIKVEAPPASVKPKTVKAKTLSLPIARRTQTIARNFKPAQPAAVKLTEEERYAYRQLMLALSITGSKLKIVKDKVEGMED